MDNQERPMCMSQGKEYSKSKNPKMTPVEFCQMLFAWIIFMERLSCQCLRRKAKKERMLMMGTCSRQRSLSMKYFNKKHTIPKTKKMAAAKKFTLFQRPSLYILTSSSFKILNISHRQYLYSNQNLNSEDPSTLQTKHSVIHPARQLSILPTSVFLHVI